MVTTFETVDGQPPAYGGCSTESRRSTVYDAMKRVMTAGLDRRWRRVAVAATVRRGDCALDACSGTCGTSGTSGTCGIAALHLGQAT